MHPEPSQQQIGLRPQPQDQQLTGPSPGVLGPALADNAEIQQIWAEIQEKVAKLAEGYGRTVDPNMEIDQVLETLESNEQADSAPSKRGAVKKVFGRTLTVIQKVGGFVADGASQVRYSFAEGALRDEVHSLTWVDRYFQPRGIAITPSALSLTRGKATRARSMVSRTFLKNARII